MGCGADCGAFVGGTDGGSGGFGVGAGGASVRACDGTGFVSGLVVGLGAHELAIKASTAIARLGHWTLIRAP
ncbi:MAG: hypothetical protein ACKVW3_01065 [Phycisphaerales bacterium]